MNCNIELQEIVPQIFCLLYSDQYFLTSTFARIQEFSEYTFSTPCFSLEEFLDSCYKKYGKISYFEDWSGFNVPLDILIEFFKCYKKYNLPLLQKEQFLYNIIEKDIFPIIEKGKEYYIIGIYNKEDINHEISHGLYELSDEYKTHMMHLIKNHKYYEEIKKWVENIGYTNNHNLLINEAQAYLSTSTLNYLKTMGYKRKWKYPTEIKQYFKQFKKEWSENNDYILNDIYIYKF